MPGGRRRTGRGRLADPAGPAREEIAGAVREAAVGLSQQPGAPSARDPLPARLLAIALALAGVLLMAQALDPGRTGTRVLETVSALFALTGVLRLLAVAYGAWPERSQPSLRHGLQERLPMVSILVALHRESDVLARLLPALEALDWPQERREIVLAVEEDDTITRLALAALSGRHRFRQIVVPDVAGPRTKPRALQTALPFLKGTLISIYDAEDRPDPGQLRAVARAFAKGGPGLAVVQAPLVAEPDAGSWIGRMFALDYACWFRVLLPALVRLSRLVPLGGTSNHFRRDVLEQVGGWDPWNVTEDADLAVRLARGGWHCAMVAEPTFEECPPRTGVWLRQRSRWIHGHVQTLAVHLRDPLACCRELGWRASAGFVLGMGLGPLAALARGAFVMAAVRALASPAHCGAIALWLGFGLACDSLCALAAIRRDGRGWLGASVAWLPVYYSLQCLAGLLAIANLLRAPHRWEKTEHGRRARGGAAEPEPSHPAALSAAFRPGQWPGSRLPSGWLRQPALRQHSQGPSAQPHCRASRTRHRARGPPGPQRQTGPPASPGSPHALRSHRRDLACGPCRSPRPVHRRSATAPGLRRPAPTRPSARAPPPRHLPHPFAPPSRQRR
jgi:glycosyltransferase XagB